MSYSRWVRCIKWWCGLSGVWACNGEVQTFNDTTDKVQMHSVQSTTVRLNGSMHNNVTSQDVGLTRPCSDSFHDPIFGVLMLLFSAFGHFMRFEARARFAGLVGWHALQATQKKTLFGQVAKKARFCEKRFMAKKHTWPKENNFCRGFFLFGSSICFFFSPLLPPLLAWHATLGDDA